MSDTRSQTDRRTARPFVERHRELLFTGTLLLGAVVFALGTAFLILAISVDTTPPAPYLASTTDRLLLFGFALGSIAAGVLLGRVSFRLGGW